MKETHNIKKLKSFFKWFLVINFVMINILYITNNSPINDSTLYSDYNPEAASSQANINIIWNKTYGGEYVDVAQSITNSSLGGYIISGWTNSSGAGDLDVWLLRIDEDGNLIWNITFGDYEEDKGFEVIECDSGGFAAVATVRNTTTSTHNNDVSVIRVANNGNLLFQKNYSGPDQNSTSFKSDLGRSIVECDNGDLVIAGVTGTNIGESDAYLFRIGPNGIVKWERTYHHWDNERCYTPHSLVLCSDGGFAIACYTYEASKSNDIWLIRTDPFGIEMWNETYGVDSGYERPESLVQCDDGGFGIMANTQSFGAGGTDGWFVRTDSLGTQVWNQTYGGSLEDYCTQGIIMPEGGYTLVGSTHSFDVGNGDAWIIRIDENGNILWNETIGDPYGNSVSSFVYIGNNTYIAAGATHSLGTPHQDLWVFKFHIDLEEEIIPQNGIYGYEIISLCIIVLLSTLVVLLRRMLFNEES